MHSVSTVISPLPTGRLTMALMVTDSFISVQEVPSVSGYHVLMSPTWPTQSPTESILSAEVSPASIEPISAVVMSQSPSNPIVSAAVSSSSQVRSEDGGEEFVGSEVLGTVPESSELEGVHHSCPTIKELVGDLDKS